MTESGRVKVRSRQADEEEEFVGGRLSKQILNEAKKQLQEIEEEASPKAKEAPALEPTKVCPRNIDLGFVKMQNRIGDEITRVK